MTEEKKTTTYIEINTGERFPNLPASLRPGAIIILDGWRKGEKRRLKVVVPCECFRRRYG